MSDEDRQAQLDILAAGVRCCRACPLHHDRRHAVPGAGSSRARVMFIGEAPGAREDLSGQPFDGRSGRWFDELLRRAGLGRAEVFVTSSVKCRPPGNRDPRPAELAVCRERWLLSQISVIDPGWLVLLGRIAARQVLGETRPLGELRGRWWSWQNRRVLVTAHPAAAMRFPKPRRWLEEDAERLREALSSAAPLQDAQEDTR